VHHCAQGGFTSALSILMEHHINVNALVTPSTADVEWCDDPSLERVRAAVPVMSRRALLRPAAGDTALHLALRETVLYSLKSSNSQSMASAGNGMLSFIKLILEAGGDPNVANSKGALPLHYAAALPGWLGVSVIDALLRHGADVNGECGSVQLALKNSYMTS